MKKRASIYNREMEIGMGGVGGGVWGWREGERAMSSGELLSKVLDIDIYFPL